MPCAALTGSAVLIASVNTPNRQFLAGKASWQLARRILA
jgi:hypothetical protein